MSLQFIGEAGVYLPSRDAIKVCAIVGDRALDCFITRSALEAIGCKASDQPEEIVRKFEARRLDCEIVAMVKFRRATGPVVEIEVAAADFAALDRPHAA